MGMGRFGEGGTVSGRGDVRRSTLRHSSARMRNHVFCVLETEPEIMVFELRAPFP